MRAAVVMAKEPQTGAGAELGKTTEGKVGHRMIRTSCIRAKRYKIDPSM